MKSTMKDALIGVAFAICYAIVSFMIGGSFAYTGGPVFVLLLPLVAGGLGIPFYYIFKKDRGWQFCVTVAVSLFMLGTMIWIPAIRSIFSSGDLETFLYLILILACYMLPSLLDGIIFTGKCLWKWLGDRTAI